MKNSYILTIVVLYHAVAICSFAQTISPTKSVYPPGEKIVINYSGFAGNKNDWISVAKPGSKDDQYIQWFYTEGNQNGTMSFDGLAYGEYEFRGYYKNDYNVRVRIPFSVGNADKSLSVRVLQVAYKPNEKITVQFSGFPGNSNDWISLAQPGMPGDKYIVWKYTEKKQSGTMEFAGLPEGAYEVRAYFNNESVIRSRYAFTVSKTTTITSGPTTGTTDRTGRPGRFCNKELSLFYAGVYGLGLAWGRLGSDVITASAIKDVQDVLVNAITGLNIITCLDFDVAKIKSYSARLPGMSRAQAVNEIDQLIKEILGSIQRAHITCDNGASLADLYGIAIHLSASQAICNSFVCRPIPADWQGNLRNHLSLVSRGIAGYSACIPGISPSVTSVVAVGSSNAYIPFSTIISIHIQVLWSVSLSSCCCSCN
jgi:hypothetical protein